MGKASAIETYVLELMNRMRLDPGGEFDRTIKNAKRGEGFDDAVTDALQGFGVNIGKLRKEYARLDEAPVLAWNNDLHDAALKHSRLQAKQDTQSHQLPGEQPLVPRVQREGYDVKLVGENVFAFSENGLHAHHGMAVDYGFDAQGRIPSDGMQPGRGHRVNIMRDDFREVGVSMLKESNRKTSVGPYVMTQNFGTTQDDEAILTGVAYRDRDKDGWYSMNEGQRGLKVVVQGEGRDTGGAGGNYSVVTGEGVMSVTLSGKPIKGRIKADVTMGQDNVKLDVVDKTVLKTTGDVDVTKGAFREMHALGSGDIDLAGGGGVQKIHGNDGDNTLSGEGGKDQLFGGGGKDELNGGAQGDRLFGGAGNDVLNGDGGNDRLEGGAGRDRLNGGDGNDRLTGDGGSDRFEFDGDDGTDTITDWRNGEKLVFTGDAAPVIEDVGGDVRITFAETTVTVEGAAGQITLEDDLILIPM